MGCRFVLSNCEILRASNVHCTCCSWIALTTCHAYSLDSRWPGCTRNVRSETHAKLFQQAKLPEIKHMLTLAIVCSTNTLPGRSCAPTVSLSTLGLAMWPHGQAALPIWTWQNAGSRQTSYSRCQARTVPDSEQPQIEITLARPHPELARSVSWQRTHSSTLRAGGQWPANGA